MTVPNADTGADPALRAPAASSTAPARLVGADLRSAAAVALAWWLGLCWAMHGYVSGEYFPIADQWALIANSHPAFAHPLQWFTQGFSDYFVYDPAVSKPYANFIRPGFNGSFWLLGLFLSPESGGYLYFVYAVLGACAGLVYLLIRQQSAAPAWVALLLAALVPLTPPLIPEIGTLLVAYSAFDPLAAALGLLALMAFARRRWWLTALLLLLALFTKETSLPVLGAVLVLSLWQWWRGRGQGASLLPAVLLLVPLLLWLGLRLAVFGNPAGGVYVLSSKAALLKQLLHQGLQWPFWLETLPFHLEAPAGQKLQAWLLLAANLGFALAAIGIVGQRLLRRRQAPHPVELALLFSWAFMILVGVSDRLGAVLCMCLLASLGIWLGERQAPRLTALAALCLALGLGATAWRAEGRWHEIEPLVVDYSQLSRQYLAELKSYPAGDTVVVLNDPVSWHSQLRWLRLAGGVPAQLVKVADFACPATAPRLRQPCAVSLKPGAAPGQYEFSQSCGLDWCGAFVAHDQPARISPAAGIDAELVPGPSATPGLSDWTTLRLNLHRRDLKLLYFDPADRGFHRLDPVAAADSPEKSP
jgi:hypothetical protein